MNNLAEKLNLLVVDTETGGFEPQTHSILSIGMVVANCNEIVDSIEINIKEENIIADKESLQVNKIDIDEHVKTAISPAETIEEINKFTQKQKNLIRDDLGRVVIAGHNIFFDIDFMRRLYRLGNSDYRKYFSY
ncbi:MAG: 3'-5' exonuclease, partial [Elusimicrobiota bacterium]|nr:3'-5' exonuclease [Elusimicrobiota bacterium]